MCLIAESPKGTEKYSEKFINAIITASKTNTDGMGYSFKKASTKKVYISKGYNTVEGMIKSLKNKRLKVDDELMVHLRIGNRGSKNTDMCHPFVLSNDNKEILQNDTYVDKPTMMHNGTFYSYNTSHNSIYSDTYLFIEDFMFHNRIIDFLKYEPEHFKKIFVDKLGTNKLSFLFPNCDTNMIHIGDFIEDENYYFSNKTYIDTKIKNIGGRESVTDYYQDERWDNKLLNSHTGKSYAFTDNEWEDYYDNGFTDHYFHKNSVVTKKSDFKKANLLEEIVLIPSISNIRFDHPNTNINYRSYMGLWIPIEYPKTSTQFQNIQYQPTDINYNDFQFKALETNEDYGIKLNTYYSLTNYDSGGEEKLHCFRRLYSTNPLDLDFIYIPESQVKFLFSSEPLIKNLNKYKDYYRLVRDITVSKNSIKRISKVLEFKTSKSNDSINYRNCKNINKSALTLFLYMMIREIYPKTYEKEINNKLLF